MCFDVKKTTTTRIFECAYRAEGVVVDGLQQPHLCTHTDTSQKGRKYVRTIWTKVGEGSVSDAHSRHAHLSFYLSCGVLPCLLT